MTYKFETRLEENTSFQKRERGFFVFGNSYFASPIRNGLNTLICDVKKKQKNKSEQFEQKQNYCSVLNWVIHTKINCGNKIFDQEGY